MEKINSIKEIQKILNGILIHFAKICQENNLQFYLSNGTLLGAVKYQGFIPWDDDIDILMPREDYNKLMQIKEIDNDAYCLLSSERVPAWRVPYSKLSDRHTVVQETTANFGAVLGVSIDIFPLDNWCNNRLIADLQARYCGLLRRFMSASIEETFYSPQKGVRRLVLYGIWRFSRCCGCGFFRKLVLNEAKRYQGRETQLIGCVVWAAYGKREITPADVFGEKAVGEFEGNSYPIPSGYHTYLQNLYGDYKSELPIEKQKSHHMFIVWRKNV